MFSYPLGEASNFDHGSRFVCPSLDDPTNSFKPKPGLGPVVLPDQNWSWKADGSQAWGL